MGPLPLLLEVHAQQAAARRVEQRHRSNVDHTKTKLFTPRPTIFVWSIPSYRSLSPLFEALFNAACAAD
jgi:hypothetical protein